MNKNESLIEKMINYNYRSNNNNKKTNLKKLEIDLDKLIDRYESTGLGKNEIKEVIKKFV